MKRKELDRAEYLKMCRDYALSQVDKQREDFKRLGVSADWDNPYVTLTPDYEAAQIRVFGEMAKKGYIMIWFQLHFTMPIRLRMVKEY